MCGIYCHVTKSSLVKCDCDSKVTTRDIASQDEDISRRLERRILPLLRSRGPDGERDVFSTSTNFSIKLSSFVLWTQGLCVEDQPIVTDRKRLAFNGDIYTFKDSPLPLDANDGRFFFERVEDCESDEELLSLISQLQGPFAFILVETDSERIWFGRDYFGRSSLLMGLERRTSHEGADEAFFISSVAPFCEAGNVFEIPSAGVFCLDLKKEASVLKLYPWDCLERRVHVRESTDNFKEFVTAKLGFEFHSLGSIQSSVDLKLKDNCMNSRILTELELLVTSKLSDKLLVLRAKEILEIPSLQFLDRLRDAVRKRVNLKPPYCKQCLASSVLDCQHSKISILFSGGLDSAVIAYLVCELLAPGESVDLINVAFSPETKLDFNVPDRQTGLQSFKALQEIFSPRGIIINFVEANITKSEVQKVRQELILDLVSPLQSVLDDSIGCCLWFAARGNGTVTTSDGKIVDYTSPARICFVGSGADELLGGYSRHRSAFEKKGWDGLVQEMQEDIDRISMRNLGRDNRIITNHGICPRMPFLDEHVVEFLTQQCDIWIKSCPLFPRGLGEKIILRVVALLLFGPPNVSLALFPKRAMQFGSRIAKLENSKEKGGDTCSRLKASQRPVQGLVS